jgi:hypothetical protein
MLFRLLRRGAATNANPLRSITDSCKKKECDFVCRSRNRRHHGSSHEGACEHPRRRPAPPRAPGRTCRSVSTAARCPDRRRPGGRELRGWASMAPRARPCWPAPHTTGGSADAGGRGSARARGCMEDEGEATPSGSRTTLRLPTPGNAMPQRRRSPRLGEGAVGVLHLQG